MEDRGFDIVRLLKKIADEPAKAEVVYVNQSLLNDLFENQFGGVTKLIESIERTSEKALKAEAGVGLGGILATLFLDLKASVKAEGKIGGQTKTVIEKELTLQKKIRLCEASLDDQGLIAEYPPLSTLAHGKYLKIVDLTKTFTMSDEEGLAKEIGDDAAEIVLSRWRKDQELTPGSPQVALVMSQPFRAAAIVKVQSDVLGSTYILSPPPSGRVVLAETLLEDMGVTFLKTYWVIDIRAN